MWKKTKNVVDAAYSFQQLHSLQQLAIAVQDIHQPHRNSVSYICILIFIAANNINVQNNRTDQRWFRKKSSLWV